MIKIISWGSVLLLFPGGPVQLQTRVLAQLYLLLFFLVEDSLHLFSMLLDMLTKPSYDQSLLMQLFH